MKKIKILCLNCNQYRDKNEMFTENYCQYCFEECEDPLGFPSQAMGYKCYKLKENKNEINKNKSV